VGTMIVGGLWTVVLLLKPIRKAITVSLAAMRQARSGEKVEVARTDHDIPINWVFWGITVLIAPLAGLFYYVVAGQELIIPASQYWISISAITAFAVVIGFVASAIGGYMSGLMGSSNTPLSGVTIMVVLLVSFMLYFLLGDAESANLETSTAIGLASVAIIIGAVVACAAAVSCDNLQDLKAGMLVGATPWKQQVMLLVGVVVGSLVMGPVLQVLFEAYGIGGVFPREGMDTSQSLGAPKAAIMADISRGIFTQSLDWTMILLGAALGVVLVIFDEILKARESSWRFPAIALAIGIYMPLDVTVPLFIGGLICFMAEKRLDRQREKLGVDYTLAANFARRRGLLFSSGLIAGEAIMGIVLAIPFATYQSTKLFSIAPQGFESTATALGAVCMGAFALYLYRASSAAQLKT
ncbi:MAG: oligopeptide transporter, OPT family, partial [bacterium]|nr:oligopeptide transporter, OPT family [bacterium]